jgi:ferritin-like metal-binding protein YciE
LRRIETVLQRMELSLLTKLPSSQRKLITEGQPVVLEIVVNEIKDAEKSVT